MGDSHELVTRREILKRGAIVGGGVLWVTPVVQTLGMGRAYAAATSGDGCKMTVELVDCARIASDGTSAVLTVRACIPPGCTCNPLLKDHRIEIVSTNPDTGGWTAYVGYELDAGGCFTHVFTETPPAVIHARCVRWDPTTGDTVAVVATSDSFTVSQTDAAACPPYNP